METRKAYFKEDVMNLKNLASSGVKINLFSEEALAEMVKDLLTSFEADTKENQTIKIDEACQRLKVTRPTIYKLFKTGKLTPLKVCGATRINKDELLGLINSNIKGGYEPQRYTLLYLHRGFNPKIKKMELMKGKNKNEYKNYNLYR